jgi:hypothetical protein
MASEDHLACRRACLKHSQLSERQRFHHLLLSPPTNITLQNLNLGFLVEHQHALELISAVLKLWNDPEVHSGCGLYQFDGSLTIGLAQWHGRAGSRQGCYILRPKSDPLHPWKGQLGLCSRCFGSNAITLQNVDAVRIVIEKAKHGYLVGSRLQTRADELPSCQIWVSFGLGKSHLSSMGGVV